MVMVLVLMSEPQGPGSAWHHILQWDPGLLSQCSQTAPLGEVRYWLHLRFTSSRQEGPLTAVVSCALRTQETV